jgi:hypothetical protein
MVATTGLIAASTITFERALINVATYHTSNLGEKMVSTVDTTWPQKATAIDYEAEEDNRNSDGIEFHAVDNSVLLLSQAKLDYPITQRRAPHRKANCGGHQCQEATKEQPSTINHLRHVLHVLQAIKVGGTAAATWFSAAWRDRAIPRLPTRC